jgi:hypothetical protein
MQSFFFFFFAMTSADALDDNFLLEPLHFTDQQPNKESLIGNSNSRPKPTKNDTETIGNSKRKRTNFDDLGIDIDTCNYDGTIVNLMDKLYQDQPKPLYVKSHSKLKVLIVCSSALRCLELIRQLKQMNMKIAKLFAKHFKVSDQVKSLRDYPYLVGVGTPGRIVKIINDFDVIPLKKLDFLIIDVTKDKKNCTILDLPETCMDLKKLVEMVKENVQGVYSFP